MIFEDYNDPNDPFVISGYHREDFGDEDVSLIEAYTIQNVHMRFLPAPLFRQFPNLVTLEFTELGLESLEGPRILGEICARLKHLNFKHNDITSIDTSAFADCNSIGLVLELNFNKISQVKVDAFSGVLGLLSLQLQHNAITTLIPGTFDDLPFLQIVNLEWNRLTEIPSDLFRNLPRLQDVHLANNAIGRINSRAFNNLPSINYVDIRSNVLSAIEANSFSIERLAQLNLQHNQLSRLNSSIFESPIKLSVVMIQNNDVNAIERNFFQPFQDFFFLNMTSNYCADGEFWPTQDRLFLEKMETCFENYENENFTTQTTTPTTTEVPFYDGHCDLAVVTPLFGASFYACDLTEANYPNVNDPFNIGGTHWPNYGDQNVTRITTNLTNPDYSLNMRFLPSALFQRFPNLGWVQLNHAGLESLAGSRIPRQYCTNLRTVNFNHNKISRIDTSAFAECNAHSLILALTHNVITQIEVDSFRGGMRLSYLQLNHNLITSIAPGAFDSLPDLSFIYLIGNKLTAVTSNAFSNVPNINTINLSNNAISEIQTKAFNNLTSVYSIEITDNVISEIEPNAFNNVSITLLSLTNNRINVFRSNMFSSIQRSLSTLYLQNNGVRAIERNFFQNFPQLYFINMTRSNCAHTNYWAWPIFSPGFRELEQCFQNFEAETSTVIRA